MLSESLNINRYSFKADFLARYTRSVAGAEQQITAWANHVVYRRAAPVSRAFCYVLFISASSPLNPSYG